MVGKGTSSSTVGEGTISSSACKETRGPVSGEETGESAAGIEMTGTTGTGAEGNEPEIETAEDGKEQSWRLL